MARKYNFNVKEPKELIWEQNSWIRGLNTLVTNTQIKNNELSQALNVQLIEDGKVQCPRDGQAYFGNSSGSKVTGIFPYYKSDGTNQLLRFSGSAMQKYNTGTSDWDNISGYTYTSNAEMFGVMAYDRLYLINETDPITYYDGSAMTSFTAISKPTGLGLVRTAGSSGSYTFKYKVAAYTESGETDPTSEQSITMSVDTLDSSNKITVSWTAATNADGYLVFRESNGVYYHLATLEGNGSVSYLDDGSDSINEFVTPSATNTTGGVTGTYIAEYKDSLFILDGSRLHYSGGGDNIHDFSIAAGGGFIDVAKNNGQDLTAAIKFKDVLLTFKEDQVYQFSFSTSGLPQISLVNNAVGCISPRSVIEVENDIFFLARRGVFTIGNQEGFAFDVLRTNELSARVRSEIEAIEDSCRDKVAGVYATKENKNLVIYAYTPAGGTYNSKALVYDRERLAWYIWDNIQANCWTQYVDSSENESVVYGDDNSGYVKEILTGSTDFGSAISANFRLKAVSFKKGGLNRYKRLKDLDIVFREPTGSLSVSIIKDGVTTEYSTNIATIQPSVNFGHYTFPSLMGESVGTGVTAQDENLLKTLRRLNLEGRSFMLEFDNNSSASFTLLYVGKSAKQRSSAYRLSGDLVAL